MKVMVLLLGEALEGNIIFVICFLFFIDLIINTFDDSFGLEGGPVRSPSMPYESSLLHTACLVRFTSLCLLSRACHTGLVWCGTLEVVPPQ